MITLTPLMALAVVVTIVSLIGSAYEMGRIRQLRELEKWLDRMEGRRC